MTVQRFGRLERTACRAHDSESVPLGRAMASAATSRGATVGDDGRTTWSGATKRWNQKTVSPSKRTIARPSSARVRMDMDDLMPVEDRAGGW
jgi:hypothetical protein